MAEKDDTQIISREEARTSGEMHYFTGVPCIHGHVAKRYVSNDACLDCAYQKKPQKPRQTREDRLAYMRQWHHDHREEQVAKSAWFYQNNKHLWPTYQEQGPEKVIARVLKWQKDNPEKVNAKSRKWKKDHPEAVKAERERRSPKKRGNGEGYTRADTNAMLAMQDFCMCGPTLRRRLAASEEASRPYSPPMPWWP